MFDHVLDAPASAGRAFSTLAGFAAQGILLTAALLFPLLFPEVLPRVRSAADLLMPPGPPPPPPPALKTMLVRTGPRTPQPTHTLILPTTMPARAAVLVDPPPAGPQAGTGSMEFGVPGGVDTGIPGGVVGIFRDVVSAIRPTVLPPSAQAHTAPKPPAAAAPRERIQVSKGVQEAMMIHRIIPAYPPLARQARISGKVELHGLIGVDGRIRELRVLSGHPLLIHAALDAVRQWIYRPTLLNGLPVEVEAPITVNFTLSGAN